MLGKSNQAGTPERKTDQSRAQSRAAVVRILRDGKSDEAELLHKLYLADFDPDERAEYLAALERDEV